MPVATRDRLPAGKPAGHTPFGRSKESRIMLVLSRKVGERIHVGDNMVLEIRRIAGNRVTVALEAPRDVRILRGELEGPAREFCSPEKSGEAAAQPMVSPARMAVLHDLPTAQVESHSVT